MASHHFYATRDDLHEVIGFLYSETDLRVFEAYSRVNHEAREFRSLDDLRQQDPAAANHGKLHLTLCSPSITAGPTFRRFELNAEVGGGRRFTVEDPSVIRIAEGGVRTDIANWNEAGARQRSVYSKAELDRIDWRELVRLSNRIWRFIKSNLGVASLGSRPILRHAFAEMESGLKLWRGPGVLGSQSPEIVVRSRAG